jgi:hypothetical protein
MKYFIVGWKIKNTYLEVIIRVPADCTIKGAIKFLDNALPTKKFIVWPLSDISIEECAGLLMDAETR